MTVQELIDQLGYMDKDAEVHFSYPSGDYWRTQLAPVVSSVNEGFVKHTTYHGTSKLVDEDRVYDEETGDIEEDVQRVVVIN